MNKLSTIASVSCVLMSLSTAALALNPQPLPPGRTRINSVSLTTIGSTTGGAGAGKVSASDDNYCGTRVPGHVGGPVTGGSGRISDADDNYCGTKVPGHLGGPVNGTANFRTNGAGRVMLNPQPLPPGHARGGE